jgi:hypothetical protein
LLFFSCDLPTAVEIRGNPQLAFLANIDIGDTISSKLTEGIAGIEGSSIIPCKNVPYQTYLIHMNLPVEEITETLEYFKNIPGDWLITALKDNTLYESPEPTDIPLSGLGDFLNGFTLSQAKTKLYMSGINSDLIEVLSIQLIIDGIEQEPFNITGEDIGESGLKNITVYNDNKAPDKGHEITGLTFAGEDIKIDFKAFIAEGKSFKIIQGMFDNPYFSVEVVIWLPLVLEAGDDGGALTFPIDDLFAEGDDLFGRDSAVSENTITDIVQSLELSIKLNSTLFDDSNLVVSSIIESSHDEIRIVNRLKGSSLNFAVSEQNMQKINNHFPFSPKFSVEFGPGRVLTFPWNLSINEIALKAKIKCRIDLTELNY